MEKIVTKAFTRNSKWEDKDELLDIVYWSRQFIAVIAGVLWGVFCMRGILAIALYCALTALIVNFYVVNYQGQDIDEYGGFFELAKEGFMSSFASFLVVWIIIYSSMYF